MPLPKPAEIRNVLFQGGEDYIPTPVYQRFEFKPGHTVAGPCICEQMDTTLVVPKEWTIHVDGYNNLLIKYNEVN
ncbi:hypothetical protein SDC9_131956 [bioreactor metagenome]|uniref:Acetophenone carboxylase-like C-terminal domain-containing protein n=1 Tax=bioreactor metagenome TaxID=1076179 RepID=A0A645D5U2_9ZZZZ